jgi:hypothetical protein
MKTPSSTLIQNAIDSYEEYPSPFVLATHFPKSTIEALCKLDSLYSEHFQHALTYYEAYNGDEEHKTTRAISLERYLEPRTARL